MLAYFNKPIARNQPVLGLDLDGTCGDFHGSFRNTLIDHQGYDAALMSMTVPSVYSYVDAGCFPDFDTFSVALNAATAQHVYLNMVPYEGVSDALNALHEDGMAIHVITSRPDDALEDTLTWLSDIARIPFNHVTITHDKIKVPADVYLDDMPGHVEKFRAKGRRAVVFDQPYNRDMRGERITSWTDEAVKDILMGVAV